MNPFHFTLDGKVYSRQVIYKNREAEIKFCNGNGDIIVTFRDDNTDDWYVVKFENLEVTEILN